MEWNIYPTGRGSFLQVSDASKGMETLSDLAEQLTAAGFSGSIRGHEVENLALLQEEFDTPLPPFATMAFTIDPPYQDGPFYDSGVVEGRWGVPEQRTRALAQEWADWAVPVTGAAVAGTPDTDVDRDDAADVLVAALRGLGRAVRAELLGRPVGSPVTRRIRARKFGEVMIGTTGLPPDRIPQALDLLHQHVLPQAQDLDYAAIRVASPTANKWTASGDPGKLWYKWIRHLWPEYVAYPNGIQILTDAHLDKARDLSTNWTVTSAAPGRWLVQAKDLVPWFDKIDEKAALWQRPYLDPDLLTQARHDFGDMILTPDIVAANRVRQR